MVDGLGKAGTGESGVHLHPGCATANIVPDQAAAGGQNPVSVVRIAQDVVQVMSPVHEHEVDGPVSLEVITKRVGTNEKDLVGFAEVIGPNPKGGPGQRFMCLW